MVNETEQMHTLCPLYFVAKHFRLRNTIGQKTGGGRLQRKHTHIFYILYHGCWATCIGQQFFKRMFKPNPFRYHHARSTGDLFSSKQIPYILFFSHLGTYETCQSNYCFCVWNILLTCTGICSLYIWRGTKTSFQHSHAFPSPAIIFNDFINSGFYPSTLLNEAWSLPLFKWLFLS